MTGEAGLIEHGWADTGNANFLAVPRAIARFARKKPLAAFGGLVAVSLIVIAIIGPSVAPQRYDEFAPRERLQGPSSDHWFGTDDQGRDVFSRVLYGARIAVFVGFGATAIGTVLAGSIGIISGYFGGLADTIIQRAIEVWQTFPGLIFVIFVISIFGASDIGVVVILGLLSAAGTSRVIRSSALTVRQQVYIEAAAAGGASHLRILLSHVVPNVIPIIIITSSVQIGGVILAESSLAFLGFGTPPPFPSWGRMLQDSQRFMQNYPHLALFPGGAIALVVFSFNMLGDGIRDVVDPRLRGR